MGKRGAVIGGMALALHSRGNAPDESDGESGARNEAEVDEPYHVSRHYEVKLASPKSRTVSHTARWLQAAFSNRDHLKKGRSTNSMSKDGRM